MSEADKHEWAAGIHAALFSLAIIFGSIAWGSRVALALILASQALAYLQRLIVQIVGNDGIAASVIAGYTSVICAGGAAVCLLIYVPHLQPVVFPEWSPK